MGRSPSTGPARTIAGIGTSAGGLVALERLVSSHVRGKGLGLVIVQHLDPNQKSQLAHLLSRHTDIPVVEAQEGQQVQADHAYTMPADKALSIKDGALRLHERAQGLRHPIDKFLRSLAEDQEDAAIGIVLTGTGRDGTSGVKAIHEHGGLVLVQDPDEAEYPDMPRSAVASGVVDRAMPVAEILPAAARHDHGFLKEPDEELPPVLGVLQKRGPPDFSDYRTGTLLRRMQRRMSLRGLSDVEAYARLLEEDDEEADRLRADMLLGVTSFFRDPAAFKDLQATVVRDLFKERDAAVRVWVAGCSTGEEAYSVAMLLAEERDRRGADHRIQVFATDVSEAAIATARKGVYTEDEVADLDEQRRKRFFEQDGQGRFRVRRELRESIAFAVHDLLSDPPLPAMDLVTCRNLLIYLAPDAQRNVLRAFHFSLKNGGHLLLGASENAGRLDEAFHLVSKEARIYRRVEAPQVQRPVRKQRPASEPHRPDPPVTDAARDWLLEHHAPPAVAVDRQRRVLMVTGDVSGFLGVQRGKGSLDVVEMAHAGIRPRLRTALHQAARTGTRAHAAAVPAPDGAVDIDVEPVQDGLFVVTFHRRTDVRPAPDPSDDKDAIVQELEDELRATKQELEATTASSEAANEELRATSEEITSMNEELRTTIEELEASKEELQSLNDELHAVNRRLTEESENARALSDDLSNIFTSSGIPMLFLDRNLRVRRRTPTTDRFFGPAGPGTAIMDIQQHFADPDLVADARHVLHDLVPVSREVRTPDGDRHRRRIVPYRTTDDRIDGLIVVFEDVEVLLTIEDELRRSEAYAAALVRAVPTPLVVLREGYRVKSANPAFHAMFGFLPGDAAGRKLPGLLGPHWDVPALHDVLEGKSEALDDMVLEHEQQGVAFVFHLTARRLPSVDDEPLVLLALQDVTSMKQVERDLISFTSRLHRRVEEQASAAVEKAKLLERVSYAIGHDLKEPVRSMDALLSVLEEDHRDELSKGGQELLVQVQQETQRLGNLVRGLLAFSRAVQEDVHHVYPVSVRAALTSEDCTTRFSNLMEERGGRLEVEGDAMVLASLPALGYILGNLVQNAVKHNPREDPLVHVQVRGMSETEVEVVVQDNGPGIPREVAAGLQEKGVATHGFGLAIARQVATFLGGSLRLDNRHGGGAAVHVVLPAAKDERSGTPIPPATS